MFYGITLGSLAVATWQNYNDVDTRVGEERLPLSAFSSAF